MPRLLSLGIVAFSALAACGLLGERMGPGAKSVIEDKALPFSCEDARRYAARALRSEGFELKRIQRIGTVEVVEGRDPDDDSRAGFDVRCPEGEVTLRAWAGERGDVAESLRSAFARAAAAGDGFTPRPKETTVRLDLLRGVEALLEFPTPLEPLGLVALEVRIFNAGKAVLRVDPAGVRAENAAGREVAALPPQEADEKLHALGPEFLRKILRPVPIEPGEKVSGIVLLPLGEYRKVTVPLTDPETGETEEHEGDVSH